jgi:hypothetical protein
MDKRKNLERRQDHLFVSDDRRSGPFDRRRTGTRREEIEAEREKIERIRAFKAKDQAHAASSTAPVLTKKKLIFLGAAVLAIVTILLLFL